MDSEEYLILAAGVPDNCLSNCLSDAPVSRTILQVCESQRESQHSSAHTVADHQFTNYGEAGRKSRDILTTAKIMDLILPHPQRHASTTRSTPVVEVGELIRFVNIDSKLLPVSKQLVMQVN
jgi:hypothetical protein